MRKMSPAWLSSLPIAHRGLHDATRPENSLSSFVAAAKHGYAIELDIHLSADEKLVVSHDANLKRMTGRSLTIAEHPARDITSIPFRKSSECVPLLSEVLAVIGGKVPILIEVKTCSDVPRVGQALLREITGYNGDFAIQSFDPRVLSWFRKNHPKILRGQLAGSFTGEPMPLLQKLLLRSMLLNVSTQPHFVAYEFASRRDISLKVWRKSQPLTLLFWTAKSAEEAREAHRLGANYIFEDMKP